MALKLIYVLWTHTYTQFIKTTMVNVCSVNQVFLQITENHIKRHSYRQHHFLRIQGEYINSNIIMVPSFQQTQLYTHCAGNRGDAQQCKSCCKHFWNTFNMVEKIYIYVTVADQFSKQFHTTNLLMTVAVYEAGT